MRIESLTNYLLKLREGQRFQITKYSDILYENPVSKPITGKVRVNDKSFSLVANGKSKERFDFNQMGNRRPPIDSDLFRFLYKQEIYVEIKPIEKVVE